MGLKSYHENFLLSSGKSLMNRQPKKLLDQVREVIQLKHYSIRTGEAYVAWIRRYILFHNKRHPNEGASFELWMQQTRA